MHTTSCSVPGVGNTPPDAEPERKDLHTAYMADRWTMHSYKLSHDGKTNIIHNKNGVFVERGGTETFVEMDLTMHNPREFQFHPDSNIVVFWAPLEEGQDRNRIAIMDTRKVKGEKPWSILYDPRSQWKDDTMAHAPFGMEWSPKGDALFVVERLFPKEEDETGALTSAILRLDVSGTRLTKVTEIVRVPVVIDFFMPPVSRFENGSGPSSKGFWIVFGTSDGLYLVDPKGRQQRKISDLPATGLFNVEWSPTANQLLLFFKRPSAGAGGKIFRGVWLVKLDRIGHEADMGPAFEQIYDRLDIHTLWYSPQGTYITWSGPEDVAYRRPEDPPEKTVYIETVDPNTGDYLEVKGCSWHHTEKWLAYTAGTKLFVHDVEKLENYEIYTFSENSKDFVAEPNWVGDKVVLTLFEDTTEEALANDDRPKFSIGKRKSSSTGH